MEKLLKFLKEFADRIEDQSIDNLNYCKELRTLINEIETEEVLDLAQKEKAIKVLRLVEDVKSR